MQKPFNAVQILCIYCIFDVQLMKNSIGRNVVKLVFETFTIKIPKLVMPVPSYFFWIIIKKSTRDVEFQSQLL
jgi:hypothetical protein